MFLVGFVEAAAAGPGLGGGNTSGGGAPGLEVGGAWGVARLAWGRGCWILCSSVFLIPSPWLPTSRALAAATEAMAEFSRFLISSDSDRAEVAGVTEEDPAVETTDGIVEVTEVTITEDVVEVGVEVEAVLVTILMLLPCNRKQIMYGYSLFLFATPRTTLLLLYR